MLCSVCKTNEAILHIYEYTDRGKREINICLECALSKGLNASTSDIDNIMMNIVKNIFNSVKPRKRKKNRNVKRSKFSLICPSCKMVINDFSENLVLGCPSCYSVFGQIIDLLIFKQNNSLNYLGNLPDKLNKIKKTKIRINNLRKELKQHLKQENYSDAAAIRDEIKNLKQKISKRIGSCQ